MNQKEKEELINFVLSDTRSREEKFESLKSHIQKRYGNTLSDVEASEAAHNLIGFYRVFSEVYDEKKRRDRLEDLNAKSRTKTECCHSE